MEVVSTHFGLIGIALVDHEEPGNTPLDDWGDLGDRERISDLTSNNL